jgi:hypothetical protein
MNSDTIDDDNRNERFANLFRSDTDSTTLLIGYPKHNILRHELDVYRLFQFNNISVEQDMELSLKLRMHELYENQDSIFYHWVTMYRELKSQKQKTVTKEIMNHILTWSTNAELEHVPTNKIIQDLKVALYKLFLKVKRAALRK